MDEKLEAVNEVEVEAQNVETVNEVEELKLEATEETPKGQTLEFWKEASRKHELNNKNNLKKFREAEEALGKLLEERELITTQLVELQQNAKTQVRQNIQLKHGLSDLITSRLIGETVEELEADAQVWLQDATPVKKDETKKPITLQGLIENKLEKGGSSLFRQKLGN